MRRNEQKRADKTHRTTLNIEDHEGGNQMVKYCKVCNGKKMLPIEGTQRLRPCLECNADHEEDYDGHELPDSGWSY